MEYGRLVVLGYSSYRVDRVQRPDGNSSSSSSRERPLPSFGLGDAASSGGTTRPKQSLGQLWKPLGSPNAHFALRQRARPNGVRLHRFHHIVPVRARHATAADLKSATTRMMQRIGATQRADAARVNETDETEEGTAMDEGTKTAVDRAAVYQMCVPMNDTDAFASITEFRADASVDMFQIGRMPCGQNDFVIPGPRVGASGTISRYAARIVCSREPPFECRIFAGGFDAARRMSTAGHALKYCARCRTWCKRVSIDHTCVVQTLIANGRGDDARDETDDRCCTEKRHDRVTSGGVRHYIEETKKDGRLEHFELDVQDASELPLDGLTKNGVRVWLPEQKQWLEVSVNGSLFAIESRAVDEKVSSLIRPNANGVDRRRYHDALRSRSGAFNRPTGDAKCLPPMLTDGAIIDLGGVQVQFQTSYRSELEAEAENSELLEAPVVYSRSTLSSISTQLEQLNVQCPVQLHSLRFARADSGEEVPLDEIPHVFPACGHVFGFEKRIASSHTCPLCRTPGSLVQLLLKENSQLQSAEEQHAIPECVFNPCGHAISSKLARHYSGLVMPNGRAICPFCAVHLDLCVPFSRLYLYCDSN
ncbi:unnamed protein product [Hyaloperonospora brassicae]|uniref:RING-type domain-containing protein n=1 Tax=Hyaloperonospora brassicae TaxID=162125 RepID=A0AAV0T546_HYABA|nr:unnamed protein product [Hyaloperonospora brassicae]